MSKTSDESGGKFALEVFRPEIDPVWRRLASVGTFPNERKATEAMYHCLDRNPDNQYRLLDLTRESLPAPTPVPDALPPAPEEDHNWRGMIYLLRKGPGDALERFADQYPVPSAWIEAVIWQAGTQDADWKVLESAGSLLADFENWSLRAAHAMRDRKAIKFDTLVSELIGLLAQTKAIASATTPPTPDGKATA